LPPRSRLGPLKGIHVAAGNEAWKYRLNWRETWGKCSALAWLKDVAGRRAWSSSDSLLQAGVLKARVLDLQATIHHYRQAARRGNAAGFFADDAQLQPEHFGADGNGGSGNRRPGERRRPCPPVLESRPDPGNTSRPAPRSTSD